MNFSIPWRPTDPCPCGSQWSFERCCRGLDGVARIKVPDLLPPGETTGYKHPLCYLSETNNCSSKISGEHYISKAILKEFGDFEISGFPWQDPAKRIKYGINSLTSKILCDRHNSSLSPLDDLAGHAFRTIRGSCEELNTRSLSTRKKWFLVSGEALELWGFKTLCGVFFSSVAAHEKTPLVQAYGLDVQQFENALRLRRLEAGSGLYVTPYAGDRNDFSFSPLTISDSQRVAGIRINLAAVEFDFVLDTSGVNLQYLSEKFFYRPWFINLNSGRRRHTVMLSWPDHPLGRPYVDYRIRPKHAK